MGFWDSFWGTEELLKRDKQVARKNAGFLKRIPSQRVHALKASLDGKIFIPAFFGYYVKVGDFLSTYVGRIIILKANYHGVTFTVVDSIAKDLIGKTYYQEAADFKGDMRTYPFHEAGKKARPIVKIAELELNLIMGIASAASGVVLAAVIATNITQFVVENEKEFPRWMNMLKVVFAVNNTIKKYAPTLHRKTISFLLKGLLKGVKIGTVPVASNLPAAYYRKKVDADNLAKLLGTIIGSIGKRALKKRISVGAIFWVIIQKVIIDVLKTFPGAVSITVGQKKKMAKNLIQQFRKAGVKISEAEAMKIIKEIRRNPEIIKKNFKRLQNTLRKL